MDAEEEAREMTGRGDSEGPGDVGTVLGGGGEVAELGACEVEVGAGEGDCNGDGDEGDGDSDVDDAEGFGSFGGAVADRIEDRLAEDGRDLEAAESEDCSTRGEARGG